MFRYGDKVQFSSRGMRGLTGFVRDTRPGMVLVQWRPGDREWVRAENLVKLPESRWAARELLAVAKELSGDCLL